MLIFLSTVIDCSSKTKTEIIRCSKYNANKKVFKSAYKYSRKTNPDSQCNKRFCFTGLWLGDAAELSNFVLPSQIQDNWSNNIMPILNKATWSKLFDACLGDFDSNVILNEKDKLSSFQCQAIPYDQSWTIAVFAFNLRNLPCRVPTYFQICPSFDRCGTVGITLNGGSLYRMA